MTRHFCTPESICEESQHTTRRHIDYIQDSGGARSGTIEVQLCTLGGSEINTKVYHGAGPSALLLAFALLTH